MLLAKRTPKPKTKVCTKCGVRRRLKSFYPKTPPYSTGVTAQCKKCILAKQKADYKAGRRRDPDSNYNRAATLKHLYGISLEQYDKMLEAQGGVCAICGAPPKKLRLAVDHDHKTKRTRGLLCWFCNRAIGMLRDDPARCKAAAAYLTRKKAKGLS